MPDPNQNVEEIEDNGPDEKPSDDIVSYEFRGLGMGEVSGIVDRLKLLSVGVHDVANYHDVWEYQMSLNDIFANMNMMLVYSHDSMRSDVNEKGEIEAVMHSELPKFGVSEVNLATMMLNMLDLCQEKGLRLPEAMAAVYDYRVKLIQDDLAKLKKEAETNDKH